jgi:hypothetical protein
MSAATPVQPPAAGKKTSKILESAGDEATVQMNLQNENCFWNDAAFTQGQRVSNGGKTYECHFGKWLPVED